MKMFYRSPVIGKTDYQFNGYSLIVRVDPNEPSRVSDFAATGNRRQ